MAKGTLRGQVSDQSGKPLSGVRVQIGWRHDTTDRRGQYSISWLTPGKYNEVFSKQGYGGVLMAVTINAGTNPPINVTMVLLLGTLTGRVTDSRSGAAIQGVTVTLGSGTPATTDAQGNYNLIDITPGSYPLSFTKAGYQPVTM